MKKIFKNVGGNQFRLLTESINHESNESHLVREGLKKVFLAGDKELSYTKIGGVGLGYVKSVSDASKIALKEARIIAKEYGYRDDENQAKFIKEEEQHQEKDMSNSEEKTEVEIANAILSELSLLPKSYIRDNIEKLARKLKSMHGAEPTDDKNFEQY